MLLVVRNGQGVERSQHLLGTCADAKVFGEIYPADLSGRVDQEFSGAGDIGTVNAGVGMDEVPAANDFVSGVGENRESVTGRLAQMLGLLRRVHADGDDADFARVEIGKALFETP